MALFRALSAAAVALPFLVQAQDFSIAPKSIKLVQAEGGPLPVAVIEISGGPTPQPWTASAATDNPDDPWIELRNPSGTTPAQLIVGVVPWRGGERKPGKYSGKITIHAGSATETVPVEWEVRPALPPPAISSV